MRRRPRQADAGPMPADLAAGPASYAGEAVWRAACSRWSADNGYGLNGYKQFLPAKVRYAVSAKGRCRFRTIEEALS